MRLHAVVCFVGVLALVATGAAADAVSAGGAHCQVARPDGSVWGWGMYRFGNLAEGSTAGHKGCHQLPVQAQGLGGKGLLANVVDLSCTVSTTCALRKDGTVWTWGLGSHGQLGNGSTKSSAVPVQVKGLENVVDAAAGHTHCVAAKADGTVWAWGLNDRGQLGNGSDAKQSAVPVQVKTPDGKGFLKDVIAVAAGVGHSLALQKDGTVLAWGENVVGQVGDGTLTDRFLPVKVDGLKDVVSIGAGYYNGLAVCKDGSLWGWGYNVFGQLGDGTTVDRHKPVRTKNPDGKSFITDAAKATGGSLHTLIIKKDGTMLACGCNHFGQLGDGKPKGRQILPVQVKGSHGKGVLKDIVDIGAGSVHSVALAKDGTVYCWGDNYRGQIGNGIPGARWATDDGRLVDYYEGLKEMRRIKKIRRAKGTVENTMKGATKVVGPPWPWPVKLP